MRWLPNPLRGLWTDLLDLLFPPRQGCPLCGSAGEAGQLCGRCREMITAYRLWPRCRRCGRFRRDSGIAGVYSLLCPDCFALAPPFVAARSAGPYEGLLKESIQHLKFTGQRSLARPLGRLLAGVAEELVPSGRRPLVVPDPLSSGRLKARGFNQSELLAREVALISGWSYWPALCKMRESPPQTGLSRSRRLTNLAGAFAFTGPAVPPPGQVVLLVDDVLTTGATAAECTRTLLAAGIDAVYVVTVVAGAWRSD